MPKKSDSWKPSEPILVSPFEANSLAEYFVKLKTFCGSFRKLSDELGRVPTTTLHRILDGTGNLSEGQRHLLFKSLHLDEEEITYLLLLLELHGAEGEQKEALEGERDALQHRRQLVWVAPEPGERLVAVRHLHLLFAACQLSDFEATAEFFTKRLAVPASEHDDLVHAWETLVELGYDVEARQGKSVRLKKGFAREKGVEFYRWVADDLVDAISRYPADYRFHRAATIAVPRAAARAFRRELTGAWDRITGALNRAYEGELEDVVVVTLVGFRMTAREIQAHG